MSQSAEQRLGQYRLIHPLGQGGFARVYLAEHLRLGTQVAIKVLASPITGEEVSQLFAEARLIARLEHPHVVRLLDFDIEEGTPFFVMSYAPGGNLRRRHPRGSVLPPDIVLDYVRQIADALHYAHEEKVIHRDIKPENLLLGRRNELLLSDFGIAVIAHSSRSLTTGQVAGTVAYMAPEQIQGRPRPASDQYALGVIVYEWLCGSSPFQGLSLEIIAQHLHTPPYPLRERLPSIAPALEAVVLKSLEKDPHKRFASISEFAEAFAQAVRSSSVTAVQLPSFAESSLSPSPSVPTLQEQAGKPVAFKPFKRARRLSRRAVLVGLPLFVGLSGAGAGIAWLAFAPRQTVAGTTLVVYRGHIDQVKAVAWSPDGKRIASGGAWPDQSVQIWDASTGLHPFIYRGYPSAVNALAWSPDGKRIACGGGNFFIGGDHSVQILDAATGELLLAYRGHKLDITSLAWSPDGKRIASASLDKTVQIWEAASGRLITSYTRHSGPVAGVAWSPDGASIASASQDKTVQIWDSQTATLQVSLAHNGQVNVVAWSPDGKYIATGSGNLLFNDEHLAYIWNRAQGKRILVYRNHASTVNALAWSPDGKRIASGGHDRQVQVWSATGGATLFSYRDHTLGINAVAWSPDARLIATASLDGTVRVWQAPAL